MAAGKPTPDRLKPFKFLVQATLLEVDGTGGIVREVLTEPATVYGLDGIQAWVDAFPDELAKLQAVAPDVENV